MVNSTSFVGGGKTGERSGEVMVLGLTGGDEDRTGAMSAVRRTYGVP